VNAVSVSLIGVLCLGLAGCLGKRPEAWAEAYHENNQTMVENPAAAEQNPDSPQGLDGATAEQVFGKFEKRQGESKSPGESPSIINIDSGGRN